MSEFFTPEEINEAFLAAPPLLAKQIWDFTVNFPNWVRDLWLLEEWPRGAGTVAEQLIFRGSLGQIERGFDKWQRLGNVSGCDPCAGPDCSYNWTTMGGHAMERKLASLMKRDFRSPEYCIEEIQTTAHFRQVFAKVVENLYRQIDFFKEQNIGLNYLLALAKKFVVDAAGPKINTADPYTFPNVGTTRLSTLNINMLEFFYENMRRIPDAVPYDVIDGQPIYAMLTSHQMAARLYRDDANLRQDVRFSGLANDLLTKYNFMSTVRGMFITIPILNIPRYNIVAGEPVEVLPFVNHVPGEVGEYSYLNPAYEAATHELVIIHGKYPFKVMFMPTETSLGENTSFGPEATFMNTWFWINPLTRQDPGRRTGFFWTGVKMALASQFSGGIYAILVERPSVALMAMYTPNPECPEEPPTCTNIIDETGCPCPVVLDVYADPFVSGQYIFTLATELDSAAEPDDPIIFEFDNGGTVTGNIETISTDRKTIAVSFTDVTIDVGQCKHIISIHCTDHCSCSATVRMTQACGSVAGQGGIYTCTVKLFLDKNLCGTYTGQTPDTLTLFMDNCTTEVGTVTAIDTENSIYTVTFTGTTEACSCDLTVSKVCVVPTVGNGCPACDTDLTPCVPPTPPPPG